MSVAEMNDKIKKINVPLFCTYMFHHSSNEKFIKSLTSFIFNIPCKCFGTSNVLFGGLNKFTFPFIYETIKSDNTKEVIFHQVIQDMD